MLFRIVSVSNNLIRIKDHIYDMLTEHYEYRLEVRTKIAGGFSHDVLGGYYEYRLGVCNKIADYKLSHKSAC